MHSLHCPKLGTALHFRRYSKKVWDSKGFSTLPKLVLLAGAPYMTIAHRVLHISYHFCERDQADTLRTLMPAAESPCA